MQQEESGEVLLGRVRSAWKRYEICYNLASGCVEVLTEFKELAYLEGSFDYFEDGDKTPIDVFRDMERCEKACGGDLARFYSNYLLYRLYGSILEYPAGLSSTQQYEILCEMALFYVIHFSRFHTLSGLTEPKCIQEINWCYRFFAHGRTRRKAFFEKIKEGVEGEREAVKNFFDFV
jgi:hypothetical protein